LWNGNATHKYVDCGMEMQHTSMWIVDFVHLCELKKPKICFVPTHRSRDRDAPTWLSPTTRDTLTHISENLNRSSTAV